MFSIKKKEEKKKQLYDTLAYIFILKGIQCKAFLWLFVVYISQNVF